jgi:hypothetical protein
MDESPIDWRARAEAADARVAALEEQVSDLIARLSKDASNSHSSPSSDRPGRRQRRKKKGSGRKPGGQPGHKGHHRALLPESEVDHPVPVRAESRRCCGASLEGRPAVGEPMRVQQAELPRIRPVITEFQAVRVTCACGAINATPVRRDQTGCTGPRLMATIAPLAGRYRLARDETTGLLRDLLGVVDASPDDAETDLILRGAHPMFGDWHAFKAGELTRDGRPPRGDRPRLVGGAGLRGPSVARRQPERAGAYQRTPAATCSRSM